MGSGLSTGETFRWHGSRASVRLGRQSLDGMAPSSRWSAKAPYPEGAQFLARLLRIETRMVPGEFRLIEMPYGDLSRKICAPQPSAGLPALRGRAGATSFEGAIPSQTLHPAAVSRLMPRAILRTSSVIGNIFAASFWRFGFASGSLRVRFELAAGERGRRHPTRRRLFARARRAWCFANGRQQRSLSDSGNAGVPRSKDDGASFVSWSGSAAVRLRPAGPAIVANTRPTRRMAPPPSPDKARLG